MIFYLFKNKAVQTFIDNSHTIVKRFRPIDEAIFTLADMYTTNDNFITFFIYCLQQTNA